MIKRLLFVLVISLGAYHTFTEQAVEHGPGVLAPEAPRQSARSSTPFQHKGYTITPLADFSLTARVLGAEHYRFDREADLAPVDLALGWGPMSDSSVLESISISQSGRFYFWSASALPIPARQIVRHSANMHMVPADEFIEDQLKDIRTGDIVSINGFLIRADSPEGWHWISSLTRDDSGRGACELIWVSDLALETSST